MPDPTGNPSPQRTTGPSPPTPESGAAGLLGGLMDLLTSRIALIRIEAAEAAGYALRRVVSLVAAGVLALFLWALLLAGGIGALAAFTGWGWFWITLGAAGLHLVVIGGLILVAKRKTPTAFPVTRAEFEKDREWLDQLKQNSKG